MREIVRYLKSAAVVVLCFTSAALVLMFSWLPRGGIYPWVSQKFWGPGLLWLAGAKLTVEGLENLEKGKPCIFYANHQSYYDIPALCAALPEPLYFIAKQEILKVPIFGWGMWAIGMVFVDRSNAEKAKASLHKAAAAIKKGKSILAFPEGTRSKNGDLRPFKKGIIHVAKKGNITMVPVALFGSNQVLPLNGKLASGSIKVVVGQAITSEYVQGASLLELINTAQGRLQALLQNSQKAEPVVEAFTAKSTEVDFREGGQSV